MSVIWDWKHSNWPTGSIKGLCARGGFEVDLTWKDGKPTTVTLRSAKGGTAVLRHGPDSRKITLAPGATQRIDGWNR